MKVVLLSILASYFLISSLFAQQRARSELAGFSRKAPAIGDTLPDLKAYTAEGKPLRLSSLKGHHTVLVFGCLT